MQTAPDGDGRPLCDQCRLLLSTQTLARRGTFKHSLLSSFGSRPDCRLCRFLWNENWGGTSTSLPSIPRLRDLFEMPPRVARLQNASRFCASWVVFRFILSMTLDASSALPDPSDFTLSFFWDAPSETFRFPPVQGKPIGIDSVDLGLRVHLEDEAGRQPYSFPNPLDLVTTDDSLCAKLIRRRHIEWDGPITRWMPAVQSLLADCHGSHDRCQPPQATLLPSRLLQVQANQPFLSRIALRETPREGDRGRYAALSYCWGGPQQLKLTTSSLVALQQGIDASSLPQTLQDAVLVTQLLGLEYLWVDALCIIQDSDADKTAELAKMHTIYADSAVTISAASARSVEEGFLSFKSGPGNEFASCDLAMRFSGSKLGRFTLSSRRYHKASHWPINKRGWTLQEAIIPPRLLVFGDMEPLLRCRTRDFVSVAASPVDYVGIEPQRFFSDVSDNRWTRLDRFQNAWPEIVCQYTERELGFAQDRPIAIAGVTDYLAPIFGDECFYGVWAARALECLLWKVTHGGGRKLGHIPGCPSWSWMSVLGLADLDNIHHMGAPEAVVDWGDDPEHRKLGLECRVLSFAEVTSRNVAESWPDVLTADVGTDAYVSIHNDCWADDASVLLLCRTSNRHLLALAATRGADGTYRRVGLMELRHVPGWLSQPKSKVTLA